ncbi:MAG: RecX family transcriptional regulator [Bacteroidales bacterium]|nr:RecX family transcriptional regulator [Bacteroidales bacterium]
MDNNQIFKDIISKLEHYCGYQERCSIDVEMKLHKIDAPSNIYDDVFAYLRENNFLDDLRYAKSFTRGKFYNNKWGKNKIFAALRAKRINTSSINIALEEIDEQEYYNTLVHICRIKTNNIGGIESMNNKKKLLNFAMQRGFESKLIWRFINVTNK